MLQVERRNIYFCEFSSTNTVSMLPHIYGHLRLFAEKNPIVKNHYIWNDPFITYPIDYSLIKNPSVFAFSAYIWNFRRCLETAKQVKKRFPQCLIVFGGMHMNGNHIPIMQKHPFIDIVVKKEGEGPFTELLLENLNPAPDWSKVKGVAFRENNMIFETPRSGNISLAGFNESPFEVYYDYYKTIKSPQLFAVLETTRGCPYSCTYCNWGAMTENKVIPFPLEKVRKDIEFLSKLAPDALHLADGNFGILARDVKISEILVDEFNKRNPEKTYINATYAKVFNDGVLQTYQTLKQGKWRGGLTTLSINSQTMNPESLKVIKRSSIGPHLIEKKMELIFKYFDDLEIISSDFIIGLPGETLETFIDGIIYLLVKGIYKFNVYALIILPGAEIENEDLFLQYSMCMRSENILGHIFSGESGPFEEEASIVYQTNLMTETHIRFGMVFAAACMLFYPVVKMMFSKNEISESSKLKKLFLELTHEIIKSRKPVREYMAHHKILFTFHKKFVPLLREDFRSHKKEYYLLFQKISSHIEILT